jgi:hypothetical protein
MQASVKESNQLRIPNNSYFCSISMKYEPIHRIQSIYPHYYTL